jgi:hypothetical protein
MVIRVTAGFTDIRQAWFGEVLPISAVGARIVREIVDPA